MKRSLSLAYLENGTQDQIVAHLERELELNRLEYDGELTMPTMTATPSNYHHQNTEQTKTVYHCCKKPGHFFRGFRRTIKKEQQQRNDPSTQNMKSSTPKSFAPGLHCQRTNHPPQKSWSGPNAGNRLKRLKQDHPADNQNDGHEQGNLTYPGLS